MHVTEIMTEKGLAACGLVCWAGGLVGSALLEWASLSIPYVSSMAVGIGGAVAGTGFFGLSFAFRSE